MLRAEEQRSTRPLPAVCTQCVPAGVGKTFPKMRETTGTKDHGGPILRTRQMGRQSLHETLEGVEMTVLGSHDRRFKDEPQSVHPTLRRSQDVQDQDHLPQHSWTRIANRRGSSMERSQPRLHRAKAECCIVGSESEWRRSRHAPSQDAAQDSEDKPSRLGGRRAVARRPDERW